MNFLIAFSVGMFLGYKLKTLVEFLRLLKLKNYVEYYVNKFESSNYQVINLNKNKNKNKKVLVEED